MATIKQLRTSPGCSPHNRSHLTRPVIILETPSQGSQQFSRECKALHCGASGGGHGDRWLRPDAIEMSDEDWNFPEGRFLSYVLGPVQAGQSPLFIILNAAAQEIEFILPTLPEYSRWLPVLDTVNRIEAGKEHAAGSKAVASSRSVLVFSGEI